MASEFEANEASEPAQPLPPCTVASLARQLHEQGHERLEINVPEGVILDMTGIQGGAVSEGILRFSSLTDRNKIVAAEVFSQLGARVTDPDEVFQSAQDLWRREIGRSDMASGRLLATIQTVVDVLRLAAARITTPHNAFQTLHLVEALLPNLETLNWSSLIALCEAEQPHTQNDMAGGVFYSKVQQWLTDRPAAAAELTALLLTQLSEAKGNLLGAAWMAWFANAAEDAAEQLIKTAAQSHQPLPSVACWIAGRMLGEASLPMSCEGPLEAVVLRCMDSGNTAECRAGLSAATRLLHLRRSFDAALNSLLMRGNADAAGYIAQALSLQTEPLLETGLFFDWLEFCTNLNTDYEGVMGQLDYSLSLLLQPASPHCQSVLAFLESWIKAQPPAKSKDHRFAELFDQCTRQILNNQQLCNQVLTRWLLSEERALPAAAAGVLSNLGRRGGGMIAFDPALLDAAPDSDLHFLARRILGYLIDADQLLSLALSMLHMRDAKGRVHSLLEWLLGDEIGYDYPGTTIKRLRTEVESTQDVDAKALLTGIAAQLENYLAALNQLPRLRELTVPSSLRREFQKARDKQMARSMREARGKSVFLQLVSEVHIKGGLSTFQYLQNGFTEPSQLKSTSYSFELPRREVLDPVGNAWRMHMNRSVKRGGL